MKYAIFSFLAIFCCTFPSLQAQDDPFKHAVQVSLAPQASFFTPYEDQFSEDEKARWKGFSFGVEASKIIRPKLDISLGYFYSKQAGNNYTYECLRVGGDRNCPQRRASIHLIKIPLSLGWRFAHAKNYMSRLSSGLQFQLMLNDPYAGSPNYNSTSMGWQMQWENFFLINNQLDFLAAIRYDRSITDMIHSSKTGQISSLGIHLGVRYKL